MSQSSPDLQTASPVAATTATEQQADEERERRLRRAYGATLASALLLFASFHPLDLGMLAWVALVPWLYVAATEGWRVAIAVSYAVTFLYHLVGLSWIGMVSPEGWLITAFLEGFYGIALVGGALWVRGRTGAPLLAVLPLLGTGLEWLRGNTPIIRFPWLLLGASQHERTTLIQIADVTSVYGLSFLVLLVNAAIVDAALLLRARRLAERDLDDRDRRRLMTYAAVPLVLLVSALAYGAVRRAQVRDALRPGPRLLVVQPDFPQNLKDDAATASALDLVRTNLRLSERTLAHRPGEKVDAIVWSETMWPWPLPDLRTDAGRTGWQRWLASLPPAYAELVASWTRQLQSLADQTGAVILVGAVDRGLDGGPEHNSIYAVAPQAGVVARYDKINLVPASEYIPGKDTLLLGWLHDLVKSFVPEGFTVFAPGEGQVLIRAGAHTLAPNICFEISFPELLREGVRQGADALVCPANDGWFVRGGRHEQDEGWMRTAELGLARDHAVFRAIEGRRPVVRCVNRGVSLVVDPTGAVHHEVTQTIRGETRYVGVEGAFVADLETTDLRSFYVRFGDAFALACGAAALGLLACAGRRVRLARDPDAPAPDAPPTSGSDPSQA
ncbi:MAG: apolipoprotein N-acyltransferase [Planctomycetes bacterium]|nr:apolipoprotein N-acyltransferase [Planctomycetota bacterium]